MAEPSGAGDIQATWQGLAQIPQLLNDVRSGILTLRSLISTPGAAMATGSPLAGAAIWGLGTALTIFLVETVQAVDDDIDGMQQVLANYQRNEDELSGQAQLGQQQLAGMAGATSPNLNGGLQSCTARGVLSAVASTGQPARAFAGGTRTVSNTAEGILDGGSRLVGQVGNGAADLVDDVPWVGPYAGTAVRSVSGAGQWVLDGTESIVDGVGESVAGVGDAVAGVADNAQQQTTLAGSCAPSTAFPGHAGRVSTVADGSRP